MRGEITDKSIMVDLRSVSTSRAREEKRLHGEAERLKGKRSLENGS